jgi:hypothetical protein
VAQGVHCRGGFKTRPFCIPPTPAPCRHSDRRARGTSARSGGISLQTADPARFAPLHALRRIGMAQRVHTGRLCAGRFLAALGMTARWGGREGAPSVRGRRFARSAPLPPILARHSDRSARGTSARSGGISAQTAVAVCTRCMPQICHSVGMERSVEKRGYSRVFCIP